MFSSSGLMGGCHLDTAGVVVYSSIASPRGGTHDDERV